VTVGESLTQARYQAGLTIDELSERTKIRGTVIRSIEADDYAACGGDLYVRGYVRAIAGAVGVDAQGLIREYDQERVHAGLDPDATSFDLPPVPASDAAVADRPDPDETRFDLPPVREDATATRFDLPPVRADHPEDLMAAGYEVQPAAAGAGAAAGGEMAKRTPTGNTRPQAAVTAASGQRPRTGGGSRRLLIGAAAVLVLALAGVVGVRLASGSTTSKNAADSTSAGATGSAARTGKSASPAASAAAETKPTATPSVSATPTVRPSATAKPVTILPVGAAEAFGPDGLSDGDNPSGAAYTIASNPPLPWSTNWYATAQFGLLKHGTGLLLSLGRQVTITSVRLDLTHYQGVNLELKVGDGTDPQDFRVVATADNTGGAVRLTLPHPASARYLLIWFTLLPPNGEGRYQESVYHVLVNGHR
jgi:cytoskeletal protein RodZ